MVKYPIRNMIGLILLVSLSVNVFSYSPTGQVEIVIEYQRSGGYAGVDEFYSVLLNGHIGTNNHRDWQVQPQDVDDLIEKIETLGFFELATKYVPKDACCDRFFHKLMVRSKNRIHTVSAVGGDPQVPEQLWNILKLVERFLDNQSGAEQ